MKKLNRDITNFKLFFQPLVIFVKVFFSMATSTKNGQIVKCVVGGFLSSSIAIKVMNYKFSRWEKFVTFLTCKFKMFKDFVTRTTKPFNVLSFIDFFPYCFFMFLVIFYFGQTSFFSIFQIGTLLDFQNFVTVFFVIASCICAYLVFISFFSVVFHLDKFLFSIFPVILPIVGLPFFYGFKHGHKTYYNIEDYNCKGRKEELL